MTTRPTLPSAEEVRQLTPTHDQLVPADFIDENGHMNISHYFRLGSWSPWQRLRELGLTEGYLARGHSYFTVEHHIGYTSELRLGERFSVHPALLGRTEKALHAVAFVLDTARDRLACTLEVMYVHVSTDTRRAVPVLPELGAAIDAEIASRDLPWLAAATTGLTLR